MGEVTAIETAQKVVPSVGEAKKKRPWRNKVRRDASKKAKKEAKGPEASKPQIPAGMGKKARRKRKFEQREAENLTAPEEFRKKLESGRFRFLNEKLYTMTGADALKFFEEDPEAFDCYHKGFTEQAKKWPNHPLNSITKWLLKLDKRQVVFDLGCGEAKIAEYVGSYHNVKSFDLIAVNDRVTSCDMAHLPAEEGCADIVIFCLSLMGTNITDFIKEARRVLRLGGILKIAEVTSRFRNVKLFSSALCQMGFALTEKKKASDYFTVFQFEKIEKVENKRPYGLKLNPCIYKRR